MSRIGRKPIPVPEGVTVRVEGQTVSVKGPKGELNRTVHRDMMIKMADSQIVVERPSDDKLHRSLHGLTRTLIDNMITGVTQGFSKSLEISGVGYRAAKAGQKLTLTLGYSHPVEVMPPQGVNIDVPAANKIVISGADKEAVGELAAKIRSLRQPEPYKGKGIKYEGEFIRRKVGKAGAKAKK